MGRAEDRLKRDGGGGCSSDPKGLEYHRPGDTSVAAFVRRVKEGGVNLIQTEFRELQKVDPTTLRLTRKAFVANPLRNRFKDVGCWDQSRVVLGAGKEGEGDYIHASWVDGALRPRQYICTQGPMDAVPGLFASTVGDFWEMVWEQRVGLIVMLCQTEEAGKVKCAQYWPERVGERKQCGAVVVEAKDSEVRRLLDQEVIVTTVELLKDGCTNARSAVHLLHKNWPDRGAPASPYALAEFVFRCRKIHERVCDNNDQDSEELPILVHCSAGIGRSGTYMAIDVALDLIAQHSAVDIKSIVRLLRTQRLYAVQTPLQYMCIYQTVLEFLVRQKKIPFNTAAFTRDIARIKAQAL